MGVILTHLNNTNFKKRNTVYSMGVTIVDESIHLTKLNIYDGKHVKPLVIYVRAYPGDTTIREMEKYVQESIQKGSGAFEAAHKFLIDNDIYYFRMI